SPSRLLAIFALVNVALLVTTMLTSGNIALYSVVAIGLFNSIMFPT
ncbi:MAG TPA: glucose/galactose MFS transporter, partial [Stenotrophomonas sp.]|nr:glucose/galactose MFS transporter [Stenotrophomonas sp.]